MGPGHLYLNRQVGFINSDGFLIVQFLYLVPGLDTRFCFLPHSISISLTPLHLYTHTHSSPFLPQSIFLTLTPWDLRRRKRNSGRIIIVNLASQIQFQTGFILFQFSWFHSVSLPLTFFHVSCHCPGGWRSFKSSIFPVFFRDLHFPVSVGLDQKGHFGFWWRFGGKDGTRDFT